VIATNNIGIERVEREITPHLHHTERGATYCDNTCLYSVGAVVVMGSGVLQVNSVINARITYIHTLP